MTRMLPPCVFTRFYVDKDMSELMSDEKHTLNEERYLYLILGRSATNSMKTSKLIRPFPISKTFYLCSLFYFKIIQQNLHNRFCKQDITKYMHKCTLYIRFIKCYVVIEHSCWLCFNQILIYLSHAQIKSNSSLPSGRNSFVFFL